MCNYLIKYINIEIQISYCYLNNHKLVFIHKVVGIITIK